MENDEIVDIDENDNYGYSKLSNIILSHYLKYKSKHDPSLLQFFKLIAERLVHLTKKSEDVTIEMNPDLLLKIIVNNINFSIDITKFFIFPGLELISISYEIAVNFLKYIKDKNILTLYDLFYKLDLLKNNNKKYLSNNTKKNNNIKEGWSDDILANFVPIDIDSDQTNSSNKENIEAINRRKNIKKTKNLNLQLLSNALTTKSNVYLNFPNFKLSNLDILSYIFLLFNYNWLFKNSLLLELDTTNNKIFTDVLSCSKLEEINIISKENSDFFYLLIETFFIIGKVNLTNIDKLSIKIPYSYTNEINNVIQTSPDFKSINKSESFIHLLNLIDFNFPRLIFYDIEFNCLDNVTFQNVNIFLDLNTQLTSINISLFPKENTSVWVSVPQLRFLSLSEINFQKLKIDLDEFNAGQDQEYYLNFLFKSYQTNFDILYTAISKNDDYLKSLTLNFELPDFMITFTAFCECFLKFVFRILKITESNIYSLNLLNITSTNFIFDGTKFVNFYNDIDDFKMENSKKVETFIFKMKIFHIDNFSYMIPRNVQKLILGDLDIETYNWFIEDLKLFNNLEYLSFSLWNGKFECENNFKAICKILDGSKFKSKLNQIYFENKTFINFDMIENIFKHKLIKNSYVKIFDMKFNYDKINCLDSSKEELQKRVDKLIFEHKFDFKYFQRLSERYTQTTTSIIKVLVKKKIILCHDLDKDENEKGYDDRKTLRLIFWFLNKGFTKTIKIKIN